MSMKPLFLMTLCLAALCAAAPAAVPAAAQNAVCGVVDALGDPLVDAVEIRSGYDDFALYRARFGGLHTAIDIGFDRWGDPVMAIARGRVTYADPNGWDTEKGVIVIEHTFPDGSIAYSVYGHVEQKDAQPFPAVNTCVLKGQILAGIGWPSRGRPHLHFEIRDFLPNEGGPGYTDANPLTLGWYHPLDFMALWRARLHAGFVRAVTFDGTPALPPVELDSGHYVLAAADTLSVVLPPATLYWRVQSDSPLTGLAALPGGRIAARARSGQTMVLDAAGRYLALWQHPGPETPFVVLDAETLVLLGSDGALSAFSAAGVRLWDAPALAGVPVALESGGGQVFQVMRDDTTVRWRVVGAAGSVTQSGTGQAALGAAGTSGWVVLTAAAGGTQMGTRALNLPAPGRAARITADDSGAYVYLADSQLLLAALDADGTLRWRMPYPFPPAVALPPLLASDGRLLYALDVNGTLSAFDTVDGALRCQTALYAGGQTNSSPRGRALRLLANGQLQFGAGFLSLVTLDPAAWCPPA